MDRQFAWKMSSGNGPIRVILQVFIMLNMFYLRSENAVVYCACRTKLAGRGCMGSRGAGLAKVDVPSRHFSLYSENWERERERWDETRDEREMRREIWDEKDEMRGDEMRDEKRETGADSKELGRKDSWSRNRERLEIRKMLSSLYGNHQLECGSSVSVNCKYAKKV